MNRYLTTLSTCTIGLAMTALTPSATAVAEPDVRTTPQCHGHAPTIVGTPGDDRLRGTPGRDVIAGLAGSDTVRGLRGNDVLCGGPGRDRLLGGAGKDRLFGGKDADVLVGGPGADRSIDPKNEMTWNPRASDYTGTPNTFVDGPGRDVIRGRPGADTDRVSFARSSHRLRLDWPRGTARTDTPNSFSNVEIVIGTKHDDTMRGRNVRDEMYGGRGDDTLRGRGGRDHLVGEPKRASSGARDALRGGAGSDYLEPSARGKAPRGNSILIGGPGGDTFSVTPTGGRYVGGNGRDILDVYQVGAAHVNAVTGRIKGSRIRARIADFEVYDILEREKAESSFIGTDEPEQVYTTDGRIQGNGGDDRLTGGAVNGGEGDDIVLGESDSGPLRGGPGADYLQGSGKGYGGPGDDRIFWDEGGGDAYGGGGNDKMEASWNTVVHGGTGDDLLSTSPYFGPGVTLDGGAGTDTANFATYEFGPKGGPLTVDLAAGTVSNTNETIRLLGVDVVRGSQYGDTMIGDDGDNELDGAKGDDSADGRGGTDVCRAETVTNCEN